MRTHRTRGFTLVEVLAAIPIILLVGALSVNLIAATMKLTTASAQTATNSARVDSVLFHLRRDVWGANSITTDEKSLTTILAGKKIIWQIAADGSLTRTDDAGTETWPDIAASWRFSSAPFGLLITTSTGRGDQQMPIANQLTLAGGPTP